MTKKTKIQDVVSNPPENVQPEPVNVPIPPEKVEEVSAKANQPTPPDNAMEKLLARVEELERQKAEDAKKLKMLYEVADKGRVLNYESSQPEKKPLKVQLSVHNGGVMIGWQTKKDEIVRHPVTGLPVGETQEIETKLLLPSGEIVTKSFNSYVSFSNARYDSRIECLVLGKKEDYQGQVMFDVQLPDGRRLEISPSFVN